MAASTSYTQRLYESYASRFAGDQTTGRARPTLAAQILQHLPADHGAAILDVGCGQGELLDLLRTEGYTALLGVDVSEEQLELARARGLAEIVVHRDLVEHLADHRDSYDVVLAIDVLEHFSKERLFHVLDGIAGALRPGGLLVARTPNGVSPFSGRLTYGDFTHEVTFTQLSAEQVLRACGFSSIETYGTPPVAHGAMSFIRRALWKPVATARQLSLAIETGIIRGHIVTENLIIVSRLP